MSEDETTPERAGVRRTRAVYQALEKSRDDRRKELAEEAIKKGSDVDVTDARVAERIRLTRDSKGKPTIDLSKASAQCDRCGGTGLRAPKRIADPESDGTMEIPVVCRCVKAGGGVAKDALDRMIDAAEKKGRWDARRKERRKAKQKTRQRRRRRLLN